jgi:hypothetical protein
LNRLDIGDVRGDDVEGYRRGAMSEGVCVRFLEGPIALGDALRSCVRGGPPSLTPRPAG